MSKSDAMSFLLFVEELPLADIKAFFCPKFASVTHYDEHAVAVAGISYHCNEISISMKLSTASDIYRKFRHHILVTTQHILMAGADW